MGSITAVMGSNAKYNQVTLHKNTVVPGNDNFLKNYHYLSLVYRNAEDLNFF